MKFPKPPTGASTRSSHDRGLRPPAAGPNMKSSKQGQPTRHPDEPVKMTATTADAVETAHPPSKG